MLIGRTNRREFMAALGSAVAWPTVARAQERTRRIGILMNFAAGDKVDDGEVWLGAEAKVPLTVSKDFVVILPRKARKDMKVTIEYDRPIPAPIQKGEPVGKVVMTAPDVTPAEAPLIAASSVERMNPWGRIATLAGYLVWGQRH